MPENYFDIELQIQEALASIVDVEKPNIAQLARDYNVPESRLRARYKGRGSRSDRPPTNLRLDKNQEAILCRYINSLKSMEIYPFPKQIETCANTILRECNPNAPLLSDEWLKRFFQRHPEYRVRKAEGLEIKKHKYDFQTIKDWYQRLETLIREYNIAVEDIYSCDETSFYIGVGKNHFSVTREARKSRYVPVNITREHIAVIESVNATGLAISPFVVIATNCVLPDWPRIIGISNGGAIRASELESVNDKLLYEWIQHFHQQTSGRVKGQYRLLICHGSGSRITYEIVRFCEKRRIILLFLVPHTYHFMHPLEVGISHACKYSHSGVASATNCIRTGKLTAFEFLAALQEIRKHTFGSRSIQHGFKLTGIAPFNPAIVLDNIVEYRSDTTPSPAIGHTLYAKQHVPENAEGSGSTAGTILHTPRTSDLTEKLEDLTYNSVRQTYLLREVAKELHTIKNMQLQKKNLI